MPYIFRKNSCLIFNDLQKHQKTPFFAARLRIAHSLSALAFMP